ncbi:MAG: KH domain-containing protein [Candidatus Geothermincolales bacterium]
MQINAPEGTGPVELVRYLAGSLVDCPDKMELSSFEEDGTVFIKLRLDPSDMGRIIGKGGRMAQALRTLVRASAQKLGKRAVLEISENG